MKRYIPPNLQGNDKVPKISFFISSLSFVMRDGQTETDRVRQIQRERKNRQEERYGKWVTSLSFLPQRKSAAKMKVEILYGFSDFFFLYLLSFHLCLSRIFFASSLLTDYTNPLSKSNWKPHQELPPHQLLVPTNLS